MPERFEQINAEAASYSMREAKAMHDFRVALFRLKEGKRELEELKKEDE